MNNNNKSNVRIKYPLHATANTQFTISSIYNNNDHSSNNNNNLMTLKMQRGCR